MIRDNYCHMYGSALQWTLSSEIPRSKIKHISSVLGYKTESASVLELWFWLQLQEHLCKFQNVSCHSLDDLLYGANVVENTRVRACTHTLPPSLSLWMKCKLK